MQYGALSVYAVLNVWPQTLKVLWSQEIMIFSHMWFHNMCTIYVLIQYMCVFEEFIAV